MNEALKIYCDGAAMAYRDVAQKLRNIVKDAPEKLQPLVQPLSPLADLCEKKAVEVYKECERFTGDRH